MRNFAIVNSFENPRHNASFEPVVVPAGLHFPHEVLDRADLTPRAKRELLARWASDANAVKGFPTLRHLPGTPFPVLFSSIRDALDRLDQKMVEGLGPLAALTRRDSGHSSNL